MIKIGRCWVVVALVGISFGGIADSGTDSRQTGAFAAAYTTEDLLGIEASRVESVIPQHEVITWQLYVPRDYRPDAPAGLFVYIDSGKFGTLPSKWRKVMDERNLIWISANRSEGRMTVERRVLFAVLAILVAERSHAVDSERLYIGGYSSGGRLASRIATAHPKTFTGGLFLNGVEVSVDGLPRDIDLMKSNRYVILCGANYIARESCREALRAYRADGIENTKLKIIRGLGHKTPWTGDFDEAIAFLDAR